MSKKFNHKFCGKLYRVIIGDVDALAKDMLSSYEHKCLYSGIRQNEKLFGFCDSPYKKNKAIVLDDSLSGLALLETAIDEGIHACDFSITNVKVGQMSKALSEYLWKLGFRQVTQDCESDSSHSHKAE